jgi:uncharacterized iron-regulated membrane protein
MTSRAVFSILHRYVGLIIAGFLFISGVTGAVIAWEHELDGYLNPAFYRAPPGAALSSLDIADMVEARDANARVTYLPLAVPSGDALQIWVEPRTSASPLTDNQLAIDPTSGVEQDRREWGTVSLARKNLIPFVYKFHYTLQLPVTGGFDIGTWLMGCIAIAWTLDCFIALWISFPNWSSWRKSLAFRLSRGGHTAVFDTHRSGGVWIWALLLVVAVTAVSMNLRSQVMVPLVSLFSRVTPSAFDARTGSEIAPTTSVLPRREIVMRANREAQRIGLDAPAGALSFSQESAVYGVGFFSPAKEDGDGTLGNPWFYFDANTGALISREIPGQGTAGDIFLQAQFPLHSGRLLGTGGRILVTVIGILVAVLSVTGVILYARKRRARTLSAARRNARAPV